VTGAASGLGRAVALRLAREGASVFGVDLDENGLAETARLAAEAGGALRGGVFDLATRTGCVGAVEAAAVAGLDVLVNVAGVNRFHHFADMPEEDWHLLVGVNLSGVVFTTQAAIPHLLASRGSVVNVASVAGLRGQAYTAAYAATKGGVIQLTRSLAMEYVKHGIRFNAVAPGGIDTPMNATLQFPEGLDWKLVQRYSPLRGMATAEEVAAVIAWLCSDDAAHVHGAILPVDGGVTAG
jgi:NAD(P)-dependent dehydrogenase (short-subunit alcohol dehydrogenase family)